MKFFRCIKRVYIFPLIVLCIIIFRTQLYEEWDSKHPREIQKSQNSIKDGDYKPAKYDNEVDEDGDYKPAKYDNEVDEDADSKPAKYDNKVDEDGEYKPAKYDNEVDEDADSKPAKYDNEVDEDGDYKPAKYDNEVDEDADSKPAKYDNKVDEDESSNLGDQEENNSSEFDTDTTEEEFSNSQESDVDDQDNPENEEDNSDNLNLEDDSNNPENVEDDQDNPENEEDNSDNLNLEDDSNNPENVEDDRNNIDNEKDDSNNLRNVDENSNNLENVEGNSNNLENVEDDSNNLEIVEDNSNNLENVDDDSNNLGNFEDNSNNLENVEDNSNNLGNLEDNSTNLENVEDNSNNLEYVEDNSNHLDNMEDNLNNIDKDDDKSNTTARGWYNIGGNKTERKSPEDSDMVDENWATIKGPGHMGVAVVLDKNTLTETERHKYEEGYSRNNFNEYVSDIISMDRKLPDTRNPLCQNEIYPPDLPDTSVVICFLNEAWSVLVRTVHSVMNTAPEHLLNEIILVDDFSDYDHLKRPLEEYIGQRWEGKVKILRNSRREGLIRSRLIGARQARGKTITFLDSHIECITGWLEPLLGRIKEEPTHLVCPEILAIHPDTFEVKKKDKVDEYLVGGFDWNLRFVWEYPATWSLQERPSVISPIKTPTIAGGLFSLDRDYFFTMGSYDEGMDFWGGENLEISFRMWMCGGTLEVVPCSVVHHVFRAKNPNSDSQHSNSVFINTLRMARVWMGEYMDIHYRATGQADYQEIKVNVESRLELRERLQCRDFQWYIDNIYPVLFLPQKALDHGNAMNVGRSGYCLHASGDYPGTRVTLETCVKDSPQQRFYRTATDEVRQTVTCVDIGTNPPQMEKCHHLMGNQQLQYTQDKSLRHPDTNRCLEFNLVSQSLYMEVCDGSELQKWTWVDG